MSKIFVLKLGSLAFRQKKKDTSRSLKKASVRC